MITERNNDLKFDKGTIYVVYFHTHVHVHIEKMGNLSKSKIKLYVCDNKLRSCAQEFQAIRRAISLNKTFVLFC